MNGAPVSVASRRAISVLPTPVGPIMRMFLGATSFRMSSATRCRRQRLRIAIATARLASCCPTMWRSSSVTIWRGVSSFTVSLFFYHGGTEERIFYHGGTECTEGELSFRAERGISRETPRFFAALRMTGLVQRSYMRVLIYELSLSVSSVSLWLIRMELGSGEFLDDDVSI